MFLWLNVCYSEVAMISKFESAVPHIASVTYGQCK